MRWKKYPKDEGNEYKIKVKRGSIISILFETPRNKPVKCKSHIKKHMHKRQAAENRRILYFINNGKFAEGCLDPE